MGSAIMPSGSKKYNWIPEIPGDESNEKIGVDAISDEDLIKLAQFGEMVDIEIEEAGETPEEEDVVEVSIDEETEEELEDELDAETEDDAEEEIEEELEGDSVSELIEAVEEVKEKLDDVIEEASEAVDGEMADVEEELEEAIEEDAVEGLSEQIADEDALIAVTPGEIEEECETCEYCGSAKGISSMAGDKHNFTKIAAVSPENKKQIAKYWKDYLGYDPEYVDWMLKDYEK